MLIGCRYVTGAFCKLPFEPIAQSQLEILSDVLSKNGYRVSKDISESSHAGEFDVQESHSHNVEGEDEYASDHQLGYSRPIHFPAH